MLDAEQGELCAAEIRVELFLQKSQIMAVSLVVGIVDLGDSTMRWSARVLFADTDRFFELEYSASAGDTVVIAIFSLRPERARCRRPDESDVDTAE